MTLEQLLLLLWLQACAIHHNVDPHLALAVSTIESGGFLKTGTIGRKGTYYAPMGIHKCFKKKWTIDNPFWNIYIGTRALKGKNIEKVLRRYNKKFNWSYYKAIMRLRNQYKRERIFQRGTENVQNHSNSATTYHSLHSRKSH